jgi:hypothetical protein
MSGFQDQFDFSALKSRAPAALTVIHADKEYLQCARITADRTMTFIVFKKGGEFFLHAQNTALGSFSRDTCNDQNFIMRADDVNRILKSLGWGRMSRPSNPIPG